MGKDFNLEAEEICGHYVTEDVKKLWAVQLDLLDQLRIICQKHNIKYFAGGGTLLGVIRHKGFIPWDDDIDIHMLPEDYKRFCEIAKKELKEPYFFQHYTTNPFIGAALSRIRRSDTTAMTQFEYEAAPEGHNCGIFIDIFPMHYIYDNKYLRKIQKILHTILRTGIVGYNRNAMYNKVGYFKNRPRFSKMAVLYWKFLNLFISFETLADLYLKVCSMCKKSNNIGLVSFLGFRKKTMWKSEWWSKTIDMPFENTTLPVPICYDKILRKQYGNYNIFKKDGSIHTMKCFDADTPYKEKLGFK